MFDTGCNTRLSMSIRLKNNQRLHLVRQTARQENMSCYFPKVLPRSTISTTKVVQQLSVYLQWILITHKQQSFHIRYWGYFSLGSVQHFYIEHVRHCTFMDLGSLIQNICCLLKLGLDIYNEKVLTPHMKTIWQYHTVSVKGSTCAL